MKVQTVTGDISASDCGITLHHEHILFDIAGSWSVTPSEATRIALMEAPVAIENLGELRRDPFLSRDNLRQLDVELAIDELVRYKRAGGNTVVDATSMGIGRDANALKAISIATGLNIVMGCGYYLEASHPSYLRRQDINEIQSLIMKDLTRGVEDTGIRPGIIGEIGTSGPLTETEEKVLRAAARAHLKTNAPIYVHPTIFFHDYERNISHILDMLEEECVPLGRVVMCHMDIVGSTLDLQRSIMRRGAYVAFDSFGSELYYDSIAASFPAAYDPSDGQRVDALLKLVEEGYASQLLVSHDICLKIRLKRYGGYGYDHILKHVLPMMQRSGIKQEIIDLILIENPAHILAI